MGVISSRISVCYFPLPLVPSRRGRGKFTFYETITHEMTFYPRRKEVGVLGCCAFVLSAFLVWLYLAAENGLFLVCSIVMSGASVFLLVPFFRNQVIHIADRKLILHIFGKATELRAENFVGLVCRKNGVISYRFSKGRRGYQVTPHAYYNAEKLREMLSRMVGVDDRVALATRRRRAQSPCPTRAMTEGNDSNIDH